MSGAVEPWAAVEAFLAFVQHPRPTTRMDWPELMRWLDELAMVRHACPSETSSGGDDDVPREDYDALRARIGPRFPEFGYYHSVQPLVGDDLDFEQAPALGDAIDDLSDIARDLQQAIAVRDRRGAQEGLLCLGYLFDIHWGKHLRELQGYLHHRLRN